MVDSGVAQSTPDARERAVDEEQAEAEVDRQLDELVQELRLVLPGTTVLFAFLLSVPFSNRFSDLSTLDRIVFFVAFLSSALALIFLLAEAGYHRLRGKPYDKHVMVRTASRQAVVGMSLLGLSLVACVVLVADFVYGSVIAAAVAIPLGVGAIAVWFGIPLWRRRHGDPS